MSTRTSRWSAKFSKQCPPLRTAIRFPAATASVTTWSICFGVWTTCTRSGAPTKRALNPLLTSSPYRGSAAATVVTGGSGTHTVALARAASAGAAAAPVVATAAAPAPVLLRNPRRLNPPMAQHPTLR
ncbi:hypothetical protein SPURM210S_04445 [Streptomyces purpurascens]